MRNYTCDGDNALERLNARIRVFNSGKKISKFAVAEMKFQYSMFAESWRKQGYHVETLKSL